MWKAQVQSQPELHGKSLSKRNNKRNSLRSLSGGEGTVRVTVMLQKDTAANQAFPGQCAGETQPGWWLTQNTMKTKSQG